MLVSVETAVPHLQPAPARRARRRYRKLNSECRSSMEIDTTIFTQGALIAFSASSF
jgi:hypothetical protein